MSRHVAPEPPEPGVHGQQTDETVAFLRERAWPDAPPLVVETHLSWVFLTGDRAYKLKKAVRLDFVDTRSLQARRRDCMAEVRLNAPLAPGVYLGATAITRRPSGALSLHAGGEIVDWLVVMRRLHRADMLDERLRAGTLPDRDLAAVVDHLVSFYRSTHRLPCPAGEYRAMLLTSLQHDHRVLGRHHDVLDAGPVDALCASQRAFIASGGLDERAARLLEGHGDLRPEHVAAGPPPLVIDCVTYDDRLRRLDPFDDVALLAVEAAALGLPDVGSRLVTLLAEHSGDRPDPSVWSYYQARRATTRARLSIAHLEDSAGDPAPWVAKAQRYLTIAEAHAEALAR